MSPVGGHRDAREGRASLLVPDVPEGRGPGRRTHLPFYNPATRTARDLTVLTLRALLPEGATALDGLAGTGVLGIRVLLEAKPDCALTWNDKNPRAHDLILENARRNGVGGEVLRDDLRTVLSRRRFTYVDVDPFGTPVPFVDAALQQTWRGSLLGLTATDVAPLAGTYPRACWRRYGARSLRTPCGAEVALRIFLGYLVRVAATHERGLTPVLAFAAGHYVRALLAVDPRARAADGALASLGYVRFEGARFETSDRPPEGVHAGPLWLGPLGDDAALRVIVPTEDTGFDATRVLERVRSEVHLPPFFYENHATARTLHLNPVPIPRWLEGLRSAGFRAARPHVTDNGVRTDAPWEDVARVYRALQDR